MGNTLSAKDEQMLLDVAVRGDSLPSGYAVDFSQEPPFRKLGVDELKDADSAAKKERAEAARVEGLPPVAFDLGGTATTQTVANQVADTPPADVKADAKADTAKATKTS